MEEKKLTGYPSIDKPWLQYYSEEAIHAPLPDGSMYDYMTACNAERMNEPALNYFGRKITHRQLQTEIDRCARALIACGVKAGDVVSLCLLAVPEAVYLLYAVNKLGAVANFLVLNATPQELHEQIVAAKSKVVITVDLAEKQITEAVKDSCAEQVISVSLAQSMPPVAAVLFRTKAKPAPTTLTSWNSFTEAGKNVDAIYPTVAKERAAVIEYTGGTTGKAKGVVISNGAANSVAFQYKCTNGHLLFSKGEKFLDILPPFYAYGIFVGVHTPLCNCLENVQIPDPSPQNFPRVLLKYKAQHFTGGPLHLNKLVEYAQHRHVDLSFVKTAAFGGDGMSEEWKASTTDFLKSHGAKCGIVTGYGMTETAGTFCTSTCQSTQMIPFARNNIKVRDIDTEQELLCEQEGEICVSGPSLMTTYLNHPKETDEVMWVEDHVRWLRTGDLGYVSKDGHLIITGRIKRILWAMSGDVVYRVYPMAIEKVISSHTAVKQCAVVGKADGERGYLVVAYVVPHSNDEWQQIQAELAVLCRKELSETSWPYAYHPMDKLPITPAGKVDFRALERMAAEDGTK